MKFIRSPYFLWALLAIPSLPMMAMLIGGSHEQLEELLHVSGEFSARFLIITLIATPLQLIFRKQRWTLWLVRNRRYFGVAAFGYALLHTLGYILEAGSFERIAGEFWQLGIWTGWLAFLIFVPLALTSNDASMRRLRGWWKHLQRFAYPAAVFTLVHWIFIHFDIGPALVHFLPLAGLEAYRIYVQRTKFRGRAS